MGGGGGGGGGPWGSLALKIYNLGPAHRGEECRIAKKNSLRKRLLQPFECRSEKEKAVRHLGPIIGMGHRKGGGEKKEKALI